MPLPDHPTPDRALSRPRPHPLCGVAGTRGLQQVRAGGWLGPHEFEEELLKLLMRPETVEAVEAAEIVETEATAEEEIELILNRVDVNYDFYKGHYAC